MTRVSTTFFLVVSFFLSAALPVQVTAAAVPNTVSGKVVRVSDGDTVVVDTGSARHRVRLAEIDCPESNQPYGEAAKRYTRSLVAGQQVTVRVIDVDRYRRLVGHLYTAKGESVNKGLVAYGLAWHYKRYSDDALLADLEKSARERRLGLWQAPNPIPPWEWRRGRRHEASSERSGTSLSDAFGALHKRFASGSQ